MNILIAEDDNVSRLILQKQMSNLGHNVTIAEDGGQAWETFLASSPEVVITDWMMPEVEGPEFCRRIRTQSREKYTDVIMLTALSGKKNYLLGIDAGVDDFLTKPVDIDELVARLHVAQRILALQNEVKQLEGLLPICTYCKQIRDEKRT